MHTRTFFAQALLDNPTNPLSSPYAPSFLAANRCASVLIKSFIHHYERCPDLCGRFWGMWTHAFSSAASTIYGTSRYLLTHSHADHIGIHCLAIAKCQYGSQCFDRTRSRRRNVCQGRSAVIEGASGSCESSCVASRLQALILRRISCAS